MHEVEPSSTVLREGRARAKLRTASEDHRQEPQARAGAKAGQERRPGQEHRDDQSESH